MRDVKYIRQGLSWLLLTLLCSPASLVLAQRPVSERGPLRGLALEAEGGTPVSFAQITLVSLSMTDIADEQGRFQFADVPYGTYNVVAYRIGYRVHSFTLTHDATRTSHTLTLTPQVISGDEVIVTDQTPEAAMPPGLHHALTGAHLRERLSTTIAETFAGEPGVTMRSMGPAPARPVLRGLSGERLLLLEDGQTAGDLSATSSDHAVTLDPLSSERIALIRGPAALAFGPSTLGGVINVERDAIPTPSSGPWRGTLTAQGQTGAPGGASALNLIGNVRTWTTHVDVSARRQADVRTPVGLLANTQLSTYQGLLGVSAPLPTGSLGASAQTYRSSYGIPGGFVGAHPSGVSIAAQKQQYGLLWRHQVGSGRVRAASSHLTYTRYTHQEYEADGILGIEFGALTTSWNTEWSIASPAFERLSAGVTLRHRDYAAGGFVFTPPTLEYHGGAWMVAEQVISISAQHSTEVTYALRWDRSRIQPLETESRTLGALSDRNFQGLTGGVAVGMDTPGSTHTTVSYTRNMRFPGLEELFSEGPHLAAYSFEIGDPTLEPEHANAFEVRIEADRARTHLDLSAFHYTVRDYLFPRNTGTTNVRTLLPIYQITGSDAALRGVDGRLSVSLGERWSTELSISAVRGTLTTTDQPLPWMPPLQGRLALRRSVDKHTIHVTLRGASAQDRLGPFETSTDGYLVSDIALHTRIEGERMLTSVDISMTNMFDQTYYDHLSRVKTIMPEPGRAIRVLLRTYF